MNTLIKNIGELHQIRALGDAPVSGEAMKTAPSIKNAFLEIVNGKIHAYGPMSDYEPKLAFQEIDAGNGHVLPGFVDSHTHLIFADTRETEFEDRIKGLTYEEIAERGGGILNSAKALENTDEDVLYRDAMLRLTRLIRKGTTSIEIKSGYGLSPEAEIKMLRVARRIQKTSPIPVRTTFLGAHAIPKKYKGSPEKYIQEIKEVMLPQIGRERLADYIDVFCEKGYFSVEQTLDIIREGAKYGLKAKVHVNQFNVLGGIPSLVKEGAVSVDHLEVMDDADLEALKTGNTMPVLLPSCSFFLGIPFGPARKIIDAGLPLALASDFNPGSTPSGNLEFVFSLACIKLKMTPAEALNALTINAAKAIELEDEVGSITIGKSANLILTQPMKSLALMPYSFGETNIKTVLINGEIF